VGRLENVICPAKEGTGIFLLTSEFITADRNKGKPTDFVNEKRL
jgi:hypothetical protein